MKKKRESGEWGPKNPTYGFKGKKHTNESKEKISQNNASLLTSEEIKKRLEDCKSIPDGRGKVMKLAKMWNVSHTQVRRFLVKNLSFA